MERKSRLEGISQEFERDKYDDVYRRNTAKNSFKEREFGEKKTLKDHYTGNTLHKSSQASLNKHGNNAYMKHVADVDHITPLKKIHEKYKKNPLLTDRDLREVANSDFNLRITSGKTNRQKGDKTNLKFISDNKELSFNAKLKMVSDGIRSEASTVTNLSYRTLKNTGEHIYEGGKEAAQVTFAIEATRNLVDVISGKKDIKEAVETTLKQTGKQFAITGGSSLGEKLIYHYKKDIVKKITKHHFDNTLKTLSKANTALYALNIGMDLKNSIVAYTNGEISDEDFLFQIGEVALIAVATATSVAIPFVGMVITTATTSIYRECIKMYKEMTRMNPDVKKLSQVSAIASQALYEMERERVALKELIRTTYEEWDVKIEESFDEMYTGIFQNDVDVLSNGLDKILGLFGESLQFKNYEEFEEFFDDEESVLVF